MGGFASSKILEVHGERMVKRTFDPGFRIELHQKDLNLALSSARQLGVSLPNTATAQELFNSCAAHGGSAWDHSAMVRALELMANFEIGQNPGDVDRLGERRDVHVTADARRVHRRCSKAFGAVTPRRDELAIDHARPRELLLRMFDAAIAAAQPALCVPPHLPAPPTGRMIVIGAGKASAAMAQGRRGQLDGRADGPGRDALWLRRAVRAHRDRRGGASGARRGERRRRRDASWTRSGPHCRRPRAVPDLRRRLVAAGRAARGLDARRQAGGQPRAARSPARTSAR